MTEYNLFDSNGRDSRHPMFGIDCHGNYKIIAGYKCYYEYARLDNALNKFKQLQEN